MKELIEAFYSRVKAPLLGNFLLGVLIFNWQHIFLLIFGSDSADQKVSTFEQQIDLLTFVVFPILFALAFTFAQPYVALFGAWLVYWPTHRKRILQLKSDTDVEDRKQELELHRRQRIGALEEQLIDQVKRDQTVAEIEDDDTRQRLQDQIDELRQASDSFLTVSSSKPDEEVNWSKELSASARELLTEASRAGGEIRVHQNLSGKSIHAGYRQFGGLNQPRNLARAEAGVAELEKHSLIRSQNVDRSIFKVTDRGYSANDHISRN